MKNTAVEQQPLESGHCWRHRLCCLGELLEALSDHALGKPGAQQRGLEEIEILGIVGHLQNVVPTEQLAQLMGDEIVIDGAAWRSTQMTLPTPSVVGRMIGCGLVGEPLMRKPEAAMAVPAVALLADQDEGGKIVHRG